MTWAEFGGILRDVAIVAGSLLGLGFVWICVCAVLFRPPSRGPWNRRDRLVVALAVVACGAYASALWLAIRALWWLAR